MESTIDLSKIVEILKKNLKLLIILPLLGLVISAVISYFFLDEKYQASTQILVNQKENNSQLMAQEVQSNIQLVNTYSEIVKSPRIIDKVSKKLDSKYSASEISNMLSVTKQADSQILNIDVESENGYVSEKVANKIAEVFSNEAPNIMNVDNVSILSKANGTATQVAPKHLINLVIGIALGLIFSLTIIFIKEMFDKRIKTETDVKNELEIPVLGSIPKF
ncbi:Wzz/FepE/Etk N-terminal domain-containing protein [Staphylococcus kloosii]|jgi:MPA1 family polysaccharide export protein|uniref:Capsule biosynthesis protein CapA n=1 Tax=Staphylococcus kloosii TaxID=29384 RepID=A0A151A356_9STAP|nr:Wzz/FepE/Etk N-terminal domain-containing protein [Staphylococcus kloosii]KYH13858.1 capsule biosynthesis protein CapA [Staphylococcus kloosii]